MLLPRITDAPTSPAMSQLPANPDQARRNKRLALIHVGIALAVLAGYVLDTMLK